MTSTYRELTKRRQAERQAKHQSRILAERLTKEVERVNGQRAAFMNLPRVPSRDALQQAMLDRAWELLDRGDVEAADAILEFLPEAPALALLNEFFGE